MEPKTLGRYQIRGVLGRGNMGVVYRAHDPVIDRPVALKTVVVPPGVSAEDRESFLDRFFVEARAAGRLVHPNVVVTHDAATDAATRTPFIVMELVEGETLGSRLKRDEQLDWPDAIRIVRDVAAALGMAHQADIVHRDIKPGNIMLSSSGTPKIADFGIAKLPTAKLTQEGAVLGTPHYMSPEQLRGESIDGRSDLFSLGAVLYRMLTGRRPFEGHDAASILAQVLYLNPPSVRELRPELPESLGSVVGRLMSKSPSERYGTAEELVEDLDAVLSNERPAHVARARERVEEPTVSTEGRLLYRTSMRTVAIVVPLVVAMTVLFAFRVELAREKILWDARGAAATGDLEASERALLRLIEENPEFGRAEVALLDVTRQLVTQELPTILPARHDHVIGECLGTLTFLEDRIEFSSEEHGLLRLSFSRVTRLASSSERDIHIETNEGTLLGLVDTKNYNFYLLDRPLDRDWFARYERIYEAAYSGSTTPANAGE